MAKSKCFYDMSIADQCAILTVMNNDATRVQMLISEGDWISLPREHTLLDIKSCYRVKPKQLDIPWEVLRPDITAVAMDSVGGVYGYTGNARLNEYDITPFGGADMYSLDALNIDTAGIDWRESWQIRPSDR